MRLNTFIILVMILNIITLNVLSLDIIKKQKNIILDVKKIEEYLKFNHENKYNLEKLLTKENKNEK